MLKKISKLPKRYIGIPIALGFVLITLTGSLIVLNQKVTQSQQQLRQSETSNKNTINSLQKQLKETSDQYTKLKNTDQVKRNDELEEESNNIKKTYDKAVSSYESLLKLREMTPKTAPLDDEFTKALSYLSKRNYASASAELVHLDNDIQKKKDEIASSFQIPKNVATNNSPPGSGSQRQVVQTDNGEFMVDIIAADLNSAKVIVDTASDGDCRDNCPVMALGDYASRSGAFAAINGQYFCPASYPSCADKKNSFDTLLMNKNKVYFNSDNNVYSTVPAAVFGSGYSRFMMHSSEWGRDTGVDAVIANQPMLVFNGEQVFHGDDEAKRASKGTRSFIGGSGNTVYIGVVYNATTTEVAAVLKKMGIQNALNLDSGGSIALWSNGRYLAGPGRALPFGILLVHR